MEEELTRIRREFHAHPELSEKEFKTQKRIKKFLEQFGVSNYESIGETGVLVQFDFGSDSPHVLVRGDIDALPINESVDLEYRSQNRGVSHKCGHDGHTTIILGLAKKLQDNPLQKGRVSLVFQPAEETGTGAKNVIDGLISKKIRPDLVFALHNLPGFEKSQVMVKEGSFTAAATSLIFKLHGKTSHAGEPEMGVNPALAIAHIITEVDRLSNEDVDSQEFRLVTPIHITLGEKAYGVSAGYGEVHLTLRAWTNDRMEQLKKEVYHVVDQCCENIDLKIEKECIETFYSNSNSPEAVSLIKSAAQENNFNLEEMTHPFKWGEDFGLFTDKFSGAMFGFGAGLDRPPLHHPDYDFPDEILVDAVSMFYSIVQLATAEK